MIARLLGLCVLLLAAPAGAADGARWVVLDARGANFKPGQALDARAPLSLKEGERVTLIGPDGKTLTLRGTFAGAPAEKTGPVSNPAEALAALITTRDARISSIGVIRAGTELAPLPNPWLLDASRGGTRCLREGSTPVFWRPAAERAVSFSAGPADRTWNVGAAWPAGKSTLRIHNGGQLVGHTLLQISLDGQDFPMALHRIPASVSEPLVLAAWMMEKGCLQQADALLREIAAGEAQ